MTGAFPDRVLLSTVMLLAVLGMGQAALAAGGETGPLSVHRGAEPNASQLAANHGPVPLTPRRDLSTPVVPRAPGQDKAPAAPLIPAIQIENLDRVDPDSAGVLDPSHGGFGTDMWDGTPRKMIQSLVPKIPANLRSPTLRSLARRLLLSAAELPAKSGASDGDGKSDRSLLIQRVERLQALGYFGPATELIRIAPNRASDLTLLRLQVENMLLANDLAGACGEAKRDSGRLVNAYWQRVSIFCQLLAGNSEAAVLGANLLAESNASDDPTFFALVDRLAGRVEVSITSLPKPTALHLAMLRSANLNIPEDVLTADSLPILQTVGVSPNAPTAVRLQAAERTARVGAIPAARLAQIYNSVEFSADEFENALSIAAEQRTARGRALLFRAAQVQTVPTAKATVIQKAFDLAREQGHLAMAVRLYQPLIKRLKVTGKLSWFAGTAARALLASGDSKAARPWMVQLDKRARRNKGARRQRAGLWVLSLLAAGDDDRVDIDKQELMAAWLADQRRKDSENAESKAALALALLDALGTVPPAEYWQRILGAPHREQMTLPPAAYRFALRHAASNGRRGEVVLLLLLMVGEGEFNATSTEILRDAILALRSIGLLKEATDLALEVALASDL